jgi:arabinogalactan endo-1,4-beta-galactosidase
MVSLVSLKQNDSLALVVLHFSTTTENFPEGLHDLFEVDVLWHVLYDCIGLSSCPLLHSDVDHVRNGLHFLGHLFCLKVLVEHVFRVHNYNNNGEFREEPGR